MSFERWLQERLVIHGADIEVDGDWGRASINALASFQRRKRLKATGTATGETVSALRRKPDRPAVKVPEPKAKMPPWMAELHRRMGLHEVRDNAAVIAFMKIGRYLGNPRDLPWCGDAVESAIAKTLPAEPLPSNPFWAQGWAKFGVDASGPLVGSVGVIRWNARSGHVGFVAGVSGDKVNLLGGNQSNAINIRSFPRSKFIAFRWPKTFDLRAYPALKGSAVSADFKGTR